MTPQIKSGWLSTETWMKVLAIAAPVVTAALGASNPVTLALGVIGGILAVVHSKDRTALKAKALDAALAAAQAATEKLAE